MSHHWADDQRSNHPEDPDRLRDEVVGALVLLTSIRMSGQSLEEQPREVVDRLIRLLGPEEIANLLSIDDLDLKIAEPVIPPRPFPEP